MLREIQEIQGLATNYSKAQLGRMVQMGLIDPQKAMMAGMMIQRIEQQNAEPPQTTVAQDVLGLPPTPNQPPQPQMPQPQAQPQMPPQMAQAPAQAPQAPAGVEALPTGDVGNYAGGGIVAFDDGGAVPGYAGGLFVDRNDPSWKIDPAVQRQRDLQWRLPTLKQELLEAQQRGDAASVADLQREIRSVVPAPRADSGVMSLFPAATAAELPVQADKNKPFGVTPDQFPLSSERDMLARRQAGVGYRGAPAEESAPAPGTTTSPRQEAATAQPSDQPNIAEPNIGDILKTAQTETEKIMPESGMAKRLSKEDAIANRKQLLIDLGYDPDMYQKQRDALEEERKTLATDKEEAKGMRILEAGLAIMAGESPHAFVNIGKGAGPAMQGLAQDIKDLKKADKELTRSQMALDQAKNQFAADQSKSVQADMDRAEDRHDRAVQNKANLFNSIAHTTGAITGQVYNAKMGYEGQKLSAGASRYATDKDERMIESLRNDNPGMTRLEAIQEIGLAQHPKDYYNAASQRVAKAGQEIANDIFIAQHTNEIRTLLAQGAKPNDPKIADLQRQIQTRKNAIYKDNFVDDSTRTLLSNLEKKGERGSGRAGETPPAPTPTSGPREGATSNDRNGKPIVFRNGQWVYP